MPGMTASGCSFSDSIRHENAPAVKRCYHLPAIVPKIGYYFEPCKSQGSQLPARGRLDLSAAHRLERLRNGSSTQCRTRWQVVGLPLAFQ